MNKAPKKEALSTTFDSLHRTGRLLILGNAWDAMSARSLEKAGFSAIGTSSAAMARTLGFEDGERIPFPDMLRLSRAVVESVSLPVSVDVEAGYGNDLEQVCANLERVVEIGAVGINIEDSLCKETRELVSAEAFAALLEGIRNFLSRRDFRLFLNARCDAYLLNLPDKRKESLRRSRLYEQAGADGIFLPRISAPDEIAEVVATVALPLNVLVGADVPEPQALERLGVSRLSLGSSFHGQVFKMADTLAQRVQTDRSFQELS